MDRDQLKREVAEIDWWHTIDLGHGIVTPGRNNTPERLGRIRLPERSERQDGARHGRVGRFLFVRSRTPRGQTRRRGRLLRLERPGLGLEGWASTSRAKRSTSKVEDVHVEVMDLNNETVGGPFDVVLFLGVLYHVRHPLKVLENVAEVTGDHLILETAVDLVGSRPAMAFYPDRELMNDPTNWWGPNPAAVEAMLKDVGFRRVETVWRDPLALPHRARRGVIQLKLGTPIHHSLRQSRIVVHAWK
jgi:tRNA (mo5U34)-methyltransferase